jgi:hypothetical protein
MKSSLCITLGFILALNISPLLACVYDGAGGPSEVDPAAISVAFASNIAINDGDLAAIPVLIGQDALQRSQYWLAQLRELLEEQGVTGKLHIYLVEAGLWSSVDEYNGLAGYSLLEEAQRLKLRTHTLPPQGGERILIVSEAALAAMVKRQISLEHAQRIGIARYKVKPYPLYVK